MSSVFKHLEKKWKVVIDHSHELTLFNHPTQPSSSLYQHNCYELTIQEFCGKMDDLTFVYYRWEVYSVETETIGFDSPSMLLNIQNESKESEENTTLLSSSRIDETSVNDVNSDSILSSQTHSSDSIISSQTHSSDSILSSQTQLEDSILNSQTQSIDSHSFPIESDDWLMENLFFDHSFQSDLNIAFPTLLSESV